MSYEYMRSPEQPSERSPERASSSTAAEVFVSAAGAEPTALVPTEQSALEAVPVFKHSGVRLSPEMARRQTEVLGLAVGAFDGLANLRDGFIAEVVEGYPAAWNELTRVLESTMPVKMHGHSNGEGRTIQTCWEFEQVPGEGDRRNMYVTTTIALHDGGEGDAVAAALDELAAPRKRLFPRPALEPIWGVKSYYDREQGRQLYPPEPLAIRLLEHVSVQTTRICASNTPDMRHGTVLDREYDGAAYEVDNITRLLAEMTILIASRDDLDDDTPVTNLLEICDDYIEDDVTDPEAMITHIDRNLLERHRHPKRTLDALLERVRQSTGGILLQDCDFKTFW